MPFKGSGILERLRAIQPPSWEQARQRMELQGRQKRAGNEFVAQLPKEADQRFQNVWRSFAELAATPRSSGKEYLATKYVSDRGTEYLKQKLISNMEVDSAGNVTWDISASSPEYNTIDSSTILQGHLDAVSKSINPDKNPATMGMELEIIEQDGKYIIRSKNQETTAGIDNGLMAMYLLELPKLLQELQIPHGKLKIIFTTSEEKALEGAWAYKGDLSKYANFINIDSEEERYITNGSAAIGFTEIKLDIKRTALPIGDDIVFRTFSVSGLHGGHSGVTIIDTLGENASRQNAIHLAANMIRQFAPSALVATVNADSDLRNAISTEASFTLALSETDAQRLDEEAAKTERLIKQNGEKDTAKITLVEAEKPESVLTLESSNKVLGLLSSLPYGIPSETSNYKPDPNGPVVIQNRMRKTADGKFYEESEIVPIQTATNLARAKLDLNRLTLSIGMMTRSSGQNPEEDLRGMLGEIERVATNFGGNAGHEIGSPAWSAIPNSDLSRITQDVYAALFPNQQPLQEVVTLGGLEIAILLQKFPHLIGHTISIGPDIFGAHSVSEHSPFDSGERSFKHVLGIISALAERGREEQSIIRRLPLY